MSMLDKITGRPKKAAGDVAGDGSLRREGRQEERKGEEKDKLADAQDRGEEQAHDVGGLERKTLPSLNRLGDRRALVTGASSGIGRSAALRLAQEGAAV